MKQSWIVFCGVVLALISQSGRAADEAPYARIRAVGSVTLDGNSIREEDVSKDGVEIRTEKDGYADIEIHSTGSRLTVNPNSVFQLYRPKRNGDEAHRLKEGAIRAKVNHRPERSFKVHTTPAVFGVRGTEFIVTANPLFSEAEVIVLEGSVEAVSIADPMDSKLVKAGEWSGIGGRFGKKVAEPIKLSEETTKAIEKQNSSPAWVNFSTSGQAHSHAPAPRSSSPSTGGNKSPGSKAE